MSEFTDRAFVLCRLQDDDKPMIEIMDQLSPVILESFVNVAVSDTVSRWYLNVSLWLSSKLNLDSQSRCVHTLFAHVSLFLGFFVYSRCNNFM